MGKKLCDDAIRGKICCDDLCHGGDETLCGFIPHLLQEMDEDYGEYEDDEFDCGMDRNGNCGNAGSEECDFECPYRDAKKN